MDSVERPDEASVLRDYGPILWTTKSKVKVEVFTTYVPVEFIPEPQLAEEGEEDEDGGGGYSWEDFRSLRRPFPPLKIHRDKQGRLTIIDGNHRAFFWLQGDYTHFPAWVIDESGAPLPWAEEDEDDE
jgi:hypothetical protein